MVSAIMTQLEAFLFLWFVTLDPFFLPPPLSLSLGHPLAGQTLRRGIEMTGTEETPVVASKAEEVVKLNNSFKEACDSMMVSHAGSTEGKTICVQHSF